MRLCLVTATVALLLTGCGTGGHPNPHRNPVPPPAPPVAVVPCAQPHGLAAAPLTAEQGVYRAERLTLAIGEDLAQQPAARSRSDAIAVLTGNRAVTLTVEPGSRARFSLQFTNGADAAALRFPACGRDPKRFAGGVTFAGAGCVRLRALPGGEMLIPIANSLRGCPNTAGRRRLTPDAMPYLGVSCATPSRIACDRVGIGVTLRQPAELITVKIAGRIVTLSPPSDPGSDIWLGYLTNARLGRGPLAVRAHRGRWTGEPIVAPRVVMRVVFRDGTVATMQGADQLHPGFG